MRRTRESERGRRRETGSEGGEGEREGDLDVRRWHDGMSEHDDLLSVRMDDISSYNGSRGEHQRVINQCVMNQCAKEVCLTASKAVPLWVV